jgi:hypothetical protein
MATAKPKRRRELDLGRVFRAIDSKDRDFPERLNQAEAREFSAYVAMRWSAGIESDPLIQTYYLRSTNERANMNFFDISRHPKLQWLLCTTISPMMGNYRHYWVSAKASTDRVRNFIESQYPHLNDDELDYLAKTTTLEQCREYAKALGWEDKEINQQL